MFSSQVPQTAFPNVKGLHLAISKRRIPMYRRLGDVWAT
jgi:hypothetical protein